MQPGLLRDLLQPERLRVLREHVEQLHHAGDDLDRVLLRVVGGRHGGGIVSHDVKHSVLRSHADSRRMPCP